MISCKVLIILTVIFDIIIYSNGAVQETKEDIKAIENMFKEITGTKDYSVCMESLRQFGFSPESGFYNLSLVLQFIKVDNPEKDAIFMEHVKRKMNIPSHYNLIVPEEHATSSADPEKPISMRGYDTLRLMKNIESKKKIFIKTDHATSDTPDDAILSTISYEDKLKIDIASFLYTFYKDTSKADFNDIEGVLMTPAEHCAHSLKLNDLKNELDGIKEERKKRSGGFMECFSNILPIFFGSKEKTKPNEKEKKPDEIQAHNADEIQAHNDHEGIEQTKPKDNNDDEGIEDDVKFVDVSKYSVKQLEDLIGKLSKRLREFPIEKITNEKNKELIEQCRNSIVNYKFVNHDIEYTYDENNRFSCVLTSMKLAANHNYPEDKFILDDMGEGLIKYFDYHLNVALQFEEYFNIFTTPSLCENHVYKNMLKTQNHSKEETIKHEGDNGSKEETIKDGGDNH